MIISLQIDIHYFEDTDKDDYGSCVLELTCTNLNSADIVNTVTSSNDQAFGEWKPKVTCPTNHFLVAFRMRVDGDLGYYLDDVAVTDFEFRCRGPGLGPELGDAIYTDIVGVELEMGSWGLWSTECPLGSAICSIQVKVEDCSGAFDCTVINDAKFVCCDF